MSQINDKIVFSGIMNTDDGLRSLPDGDYPDAVNNRVHVTEKSNDGSVENTRGNVLLSNTLPAGQNQTIGSYEDKNRQRIIYFNWNSAGSHGIYQFFWNRGANGVIETILVEPILNFSRTQKITGISVVEALTGDLLYWTDNENRPRKINIDKSNATGKKRKFELFLKINSQTTTTITNPAGVPFTWTINDPGAGKSGYTLEDAIKFYISQVPAGAQATFTSCHQFITVEMNNTGLWNLSVTGNVQTNFVVAQNFYPSPFKEEFIDAIKYPTICEPLVSVRQDATRNLNLIQNKIFQFRIRLTYDDNEKSVLSPYSRIPDLPISCGANQTQTSFNYIEVDFNSPRLFDAGSLSIIKRIELYVREKNTGKVKYITTLDKWQFLLTQNKFSFYNDGIYQAIDPATELKNYDALPLLSKSQEFGTNRILYGGITEGYDPTCIDAKLNLSFSPSLAIKTFSFSGRVFIANPFGIVSQAFNNSQPIHDLQDGNGYIYGGFGTTASNNRGQTAYTDYKQRIPLGGFTMYLAGTNFYAVSKQPPFKEKSGNLVQNPDGVMNSGSGQGRRAAIRNVITNQNSSPDGVYSSYAFINVPAGTYLLRVASNLTTQGDLSGNSLDWQKASTTTMNVADSSSYEALIEILPSGVINVRNPKTNALQYTINSGGEIGRTYISDLIDIRPLNTSKSIAIGGYIVDRDNPSAPATVPDFLGDTRMNGIMVGINYNNSITAWNYPVPARIFWNNIASYFQKGQLFTDHNGFFWWTGYQVPFKDIRPDFIRVLGNQQSYPTALDGLEFFGGGAFGNGFSSAAFHEGVFRMKVSGVFDTGERTKLVGTIKASGQPVSDINVVASRTHYDLTDANGDFDIITYGDSLNYEANPFSRTRKDQVLFAVLGNCIVTFSPQVIALNSGNGIAIGNPAVVATYVNFFNPYTVTGIVVSNITGQSAQVALKRGGKYSFGIVYYDNAIRDNNVNTSDRLNLKIPFYTEINPATNTIYNQGKPILEMEVNNIPPPWATHYQVVRTINGNQGKYLQWSAKTVTYVDVDGNPTTFSQATQIKIDLEGILCFNSRNVDSKVSYQFEDGDRLALIKDGSTGNFFPKYLDFKIKGFKTGASLIVYIDNLVGAGQIPIGSLFEIYNPLKKPDIDIYYEIGECFEIGNAGAPTAFHTGTSQNQIVAAGVSTQPAKIDLTTGDTWYRLRTVPHRADNVINAPCNAQNIYFIEDASISDFFESKDQSIGRLHIQNKDFGERYRPTAIRFSNVLIEETKINGLNSFEGLNEKVLPLEYGLIQKLIIAKDTLCSIHNNSEFVSMYLGKDVLLDNNLQSLVAVSEKVIQQSYQYQGGLGTQNPESVAMDEENVVYGYDNNKGMAWTRQVNGIIPISEIKMRTFFRDLSFSISKNGGTFIYGAYDNRFGQYLISFEEILDPTIDPSPPLVPAETIAYNNRKRGWETRYTFYPEYLGGARNNVLVSFRDGHLWRHNSNVYNNFYGVQYTRKISAVARKFPSDMKDFLYTSTESSHVLAAPTIRTLEGQLSQLDTTDFENIENVFRADLLKDINTPNTAIPIIEGDDLRSSVLRMDMEDTQTGYSTIYAVNVYSILSQPTNK
jgi:hypothetical protein